MSSSEPTTLLGASSFVGQLVLHRLLSEGREVIAVSRRPPLDGAHQRLQWIQMDMNKSVDHLEAFESPLIISAAPIYVTANVLDQFATPSVRRVVAVSSTSVLTKSSAHDASDRELAEWLYTGEQRILHGSWAATILRPTMVYYGAGDGNVDAIVRQLSRSRFFPLIGAGMGLRQPIHALDLSTAICAVIDKSVTVDKTYEIGGAETLTFRSMVSRIAEANSQRVTFVPLPLATARALHHVARLTSQGSQVPIGALNRMTLNMSFDISNAVQDFGFHPRPFIPPILRTT